MELNMIYIIIIQPRKKEAVCPFTPLAATESNPHVENMVDFEGNTPYLNKTHLWTIDLSSQVSC